MNIMGLPPVSNTGTVVTRRSSDGTIELVTGSRQEVRNKVPVVSTIMVLSVLGQTDNGKPTISQYQIKRITPVTPGDVNTQASSVLLEQKFTELLGELEGAYAQTALDGSVSTVETLRGALFRDGQLV